MMQFELPKERPSIIKVIGVGGGGSNAVNYMYRLGIKGVDFMVCNTDHQALDISPVPNRIQLGPSLTEGRGAGAIPEVGKNAAIENIEDIKKILRDNTRMVFITAGMGGGTGTGAAPIIAGVAKEMGILTVGIVTIPFAFEGKKRKAQADAGIEELKKNVDTLLIICNEKLREIHGNLKLTEAFGHADDILATAAKSIAEVITNTLHINVDFADIQTVMKDSGVAIMGSADADGENRATDAVKKALDSPLLNDSEIEGARYILLSITSGDMEVTMDEMGDITDYIQTQAGQTAEVIMGVGQDASLGNKINVTIIATGFKTKDQVGPVINKQEEKIVYNLNDHIVKETSNPIPAPVINIQEPVPAFDPAKDMILKVVAPVEPVQEMVLKVIPPVEPVAPVIPVIAELPAIPVIVTPVITQVPATPEITAMQETTSVAPTADPVVVDQIIEESADKIVHYLLTEEDLSDSAPAIVNEPQVKQPEPVATASTEIIQPVVEMETESTFIFEINNKVEEALPEVENLQNNIAEIPHVEEKIIPPARTETPPAVAASHPAGEDPFQRAKDRIYQLKAMSMKFNTPSGLSDLEKEPAYKRRNVQLENVPASGESQVSRFTLTNDQDNKPEIKSNNSFLHDRVD